MLSSAFHMAYNNGEGPSASQTQNNPTISGLYSDTSSTLCSSKTNKCDVCHHPERLPLKRLVRCFGCKHRYHLSCHNPPIALVPDHRNWICSRCVKSGKGPVTGVNDHLESSTMNYTSSQRELSKTYVIKCTKCSRQLFARDTNLCFICRAHETNEKARDYIQKARSVAISNGRDQKRKYLSISNVTRRQLTVFDTKLSSNLSSPQIGPPVKVIEAPGLPSRNRSSLTRLSAKTELPSALPRPASTKGATYFQRYPLINKNSSRTECIAKPVRNEEVFENVESATKISRLVIDDSDEDEKSPDLVNLSFDRSLKSLDLEVSQDRGADGASGGITDEEFNDNDSDEMILLDEEAFFEERPLLGQILPESEKNESRVLSSVSFSREAGPDSPAPYNVTRIDRYLYPERFSDLQDSLDFEDADYMAFVPMSKHLDPRKAWKREERNREWYEEKQKIIAARGNRKSRRGKIVTLEIFRERLAKGWGKHQDTSTLPFYDDLHILRDLFGIPENMEPVSYKKGKDDKGKLAMAEPRKPNARGITPRLTVNKLWIIT